MGCPKLSRIFTFLSIASLASCISDYPLPSLTSDAQYLVVDAFLNSTTGQIQVTLSRSVNLQSTNNSASESGARISLEGDNGVTLLNEFGEGRYSTTFVPPGSQYRLNIELQSGKKYNSDWIVPQTAPPIDSLTYSTNNAGLQIEVSTHDSENESRYYLWKYEETWEYTSAFASDYQLSNGIAVFRNEPIHHCWKVDPSTEILLFSTKSLKEDVVSKFPVITLPRRSDKLAIKYSVLLQQMVIDQEAYEYWSQLKKNTENLGTLFDPQPSQLFGNIRAVNSDELVLGYFHASTVTEQRLTFSLFDLPSDFRFSRDFGNCTLSIIPIRELGTFSETSYYLITPVPVPGPSPTEFYYSTIPCSDCRLQGGTTTKPYFW